MTVQARSDDVATAMLMDHVQMKSFIPEGKLNWTKNTFDIPLEVDSSTAGKSSTAFSYNDMLRYQPVQAQVKGDYDARTYVIKTKAAVFLRPDVSFEGLTAK